MSWTSQIPGLNLAHCLRLFCVGIRLDSCGTLMLLKGLGHAILGNFSTDQIVIELTKI